AWPEIVLIPLQEFEERSDLLIRDPVPLRIILDQKTVGIEARVAPERHFLSTLSLEDLVEIESAQNLMRRLTSGRVVHPARPLEGLGDKIDANLRSERRAVVSVDAVPIPVEGERLFAMAIREVPLGPEFSVLLTVFSFGLVEGQTFAYLSAD